MAERTVAASTTSNADRITAIGLILVATALFSCLDASAKYLVTYSGMPVGQVAWARFTAQFLGMAAIIPALGIMPARAMFASPNPWLQMMRSIFLALTTIFNFLALKYLQLDQTISIMFLAPLAVALLAGPYLGEWVGWRRLCAILVGFAGVIIVVRPGIGLLNTGVLFSIAAMAALSVFILLTRKLAGRDHPIVTLYYSMFAGVILGAPYTIAYGIWPSDALTWALMAAAGLFGGLGHYLFILAFARAPASFLSPFLYAQIISMVTLGYIVFSDLPDTFTVIGSAVIVMSGLYLYRREQIVRTTQK